MTKENQVIKLTNIHWSKVTYSEHTDTDHEKKIIFIHDTSYMSIDCRTSEFMFQCSYRYNIDVVYVKI